MNAEATVSIIIKLFENGREHERAEFVEALKKLRLRLYARLRTPPANFIAAKAENLTDLLQLAADICNLCTLNLGNVDPSLRGFAQAGYWICQYMYGMTVTQEELEKFINSGNSKTFLKHAYGFLHGFTEHVKIPEPLKSQLKELVNILDAYFADIGSLSDPSTTGW